MSTGEDSEESLTSLTDDEQSTIINANENYDDDDDDERRQYSQENRNEQDFIPFSARGAPPDELQATHVNHYHDLDRLTAVPKDVSITRA